MDLCYKLQSCPANLIRYPSRVRPRRIVPVQLAVSGLRWLLRGLRRGLPERLLRGQMRGWWVRRTECNKWSRSKWNKKAMALWTGVLQEFSLSYYSFIFQKNWFRFPEINSPLSHLSTTYATESLLIGHAISQISFGSLRASKQTRRSKLRLQVKLVTPIYIMTKFEGIFIGQNLW